MFYPKIKNAIEHEGFQTGQYTSWVHADYKLIHDISGSPLHIQWVNNMSAWLDYLYHRQRYKMCWTEAECSLSALGGCYIGPGYNGKAYNPTFAGDKGCDGGFKDNNGAWMGFNYNKWQGLSITMSSYGNVLPEDAGNAISNTNPGYKYVWPDVKNFITSSGNMVSNDYNTMKREALSRYSMIILANLRSKVKYDLGQKFVNLNGGIFDANGAVSLFNRGYVAYTLPDTLATTINGGNSIAKDNWILNIPIKGYCTDLHNTECATSMKYSFFEFSSPTIMDSYIRINISDLSPSCSPGLFQKEYYMTSSGALSYDSNIANVNANLSQSTPITTTMISFLPYYTRKYIIKYVLQRQTSIKKDLSGAYIQLKSKVITEMVPSLGQNVKDVNFLNGLAQGYYELYNGTRQIIRFYDACTIGTSIVDVRCDIQTIGDPAPIQAALDLSGSQYIQGRYDSTKHQSDVDTIIANYRDVANTLQFNQTQNYLQPQQMYDQAWNAQYGAQVATLTQTMQTMYADAGSGKIPINADYYSTMDTLGKQIKALNDKKIKVDPALGATDYSESGVYLRFFIDTNGKPCGFSEGIDAALTFNTLYNSYIQVPIGNMPGTINYIPITSYTKNPQATMDCTTATGLKWILADYQDFARTGISGELMKFGWDLTGSLVIESVLGSKQVSPLECIVVWNESIYDESNKKLSGPTIKGAYIRYTRNVDQWYAKENIFDSSGFHMGTVTSTATAYSIAFSAAKSDNPYSVAGTTVAVTKMTTPIVFPKVLVDETDLDTADGLCPAIRCDAILPKLVDQFNNDYNEAGTILRVTKVTTPNSMQCDIQADINYDIIKQPPDGSDPPTSTKKGIVNETRPFLVSLDLGTCTYRANDYGTENTGYSIQDTTPALQSPFNYSEYAATDLKTKTATLFKPITDTLSSAYSAVTTAISPFRKTTYATIGKMNSFAGCPQVKCSDPAVMNDFIKAYENLNWQSSRINSILGAGQLDSQTCDFTYDAAPLSIDPATNKIVKGALKTFGARCTMIIDVTVGSCYYKVASFVAIDPSPNYESLKIFATKPTTVSLFATPYINDRPIVYIDCKSKLASYLIKQRGRNWFSMHTQNKFPHALLDAKNLDLQTCSFNLVLNPSMNGTTDKYFSTEARQYYLAAAGTAINAKRTYRFVKDANNRFTLDDPLVSWEANTWMDGYKDANGKPYIQKVSEENLVWNAGPKTGNYIWGKPANFDWKTYTPKPIRVDISNTQLNFATTCPQIDCASTSVQALSGLSVRAAGQVNYNTCEFLVTDISGLPFGEAVKNVGFYTDDYPTTCSVGVRTVEPGVESASKWKYVPNPSDPALIALTRSTFAARYSVPGSEKNYTLIKFISGGVQSDLTVVYEVVLQEFDKDGNLTHFYGTSAAAVATPEPARFIAVHFRRDFDSSKPVYVYAMLLLDTTFSPAQVAPGSQLYLTPYISDDSHVYQSVQYSEIKFVSEDMVAGMVYRIPWAGANYGQSLQIISNELPVPIKYMSGPTYPRVPITDTAVVPNPTTAMTAFKYLKITFLGSPDIKDSMVELLRYNFYAGTKLLLFPSGSYSLLANGVTGKTACAYTTTSSGTCAIANPGSFYDDPMALATSSDLTTLKHMSLPVGYSILIQNPVAVTPTAFSFMTGYNAYRNPTKWLVEGSVNGVYWKKLHDQRAADFVYPVEGQSYYLSPMFDLNGGAATVRTQLSNIPKNFFDCGIVPTDWKYIKSIYDNGLQTNIQMQVPTTDYDSYDTDIKPPGDSLKISIYVTGIASYISSKLENAIYYTVNYGIVVIGTKTSMIRVNPSYINISSASDTIKNLFANKFQSITKITYSKAQACAQVTPMSQVLPSLTMPIVPPLSVLFTSPTSVPTGTIFPFGWGGFTGLDYMRNIGQYVLMDINFGINPFLETYSYYTNKINQTGMRDQLALTVSLNTSKFIGLIDQTSPYYGRQYWPNDYNWQPYNDETPGTLYLVPFPTSEQKIVPRSGYNFYIRKDTLIAKAIRFTPTKLRSSTATTCSIGLISFSINGSPIPIQSAVATSGSNTYQGTIVSTVYYAEEAAAAAGAAATASLEVTLEQHTAAAATAAAAALARAAATAIAEPAFWKVTGHSFTGVPYSATSRPVFIITFANQYLFNSYTFSTSADVVGNDPLQWTMDYSIDGTTWSNFHTITTDAAMPTVRGASVTADVTTLTPNFTQVPAISTMTTCNLLPTDWSVVGPFFTKFATKQSVNIVWIAQYGYIALTNTVYYIINTESTPDMYIKLPLNTTTCSLVQIPTIYISSTAFLEQPTMTTFTGITNLATGAILPPLWGGFTLGTCATKSSSLLLGWTPNEWISANTLISAFNKSATIGTQNYSQFIMRITGTSYNDSQNSVTYKFTSGLLLANGNTLNPPSLNTGVLAPYYTNNFTQYATVVFNKNNCKTLQTVVSITYSWTSSATFSAFNPIYTRISFTGYIYPGNDMISVMQSPTILSIPIGSIIIGLGVASGTTIKSTSSGQTYDITPPYQTLGSYGSQVTLIALISSPPATLPYGYGGFSPSFCGITTATDIRVLNALFAAYNTNISTTFSSTASSATPANYSLLINNISQHGYNATTNTAYYKIKVVIIMDIAAQAAWIKAQLDTLSTIYGGVNDINYISKAPGIINSQVTKPINPIQLSSINYYANNFTEYVKVVLGQSDCQTIPVTLTKSFTAFTDAPALTAFTMPTTLTLPRGYGTFNLSDYGTSPADWSVISPMITPLTQTASATVNGISYGFTIIPSSIKQYAFDQVQNVVYYQVKLYIRTTGTPPPGNLTINPVSFTTLTSTPVLTPTLASYYTNNFLLIVKLTYNRTDGTAACTFSKIETSWTPFTGQPAWIAFPGVVNPPATYPSGWGGMYVRNSVTTKYIKYYPIDTTLRVNLTADTTGQMPGNFYFKLNLYYNGNKLTIPAGTEVSTVTNDYDDNTPWKIVPTGDQFYPIDANGHINYTIDYTKANQYNSTYTAHVYYRNRPLYDGTDLISNPPKYLANQNPSVLLDGKLTTYLLTDLSTRFIDSTVYRSDSIYIYFYIVFPSPITFDSVTFTLPSTPTISSSVIPARGWNILTSMDDITYTTFHKFTMLPLVNSVRFTWPSPLQGTETSVISSSQQLLEAPTDAMIAASNSAVASAQAKEAIFTAAATATAAANAAAAATVQGYITAAATAGANGNFTAQATQANLAVSAAQVFVTSVTANTAAANASDAGSTAKASYTAAATAAQQVVNSANTALASVSASINAAADAANAVANTAARDIVQTHIAFANNAKEAGVTAGELPTAERSYKAEADEASKAVKAAEVFVTAYNANTLAANAAAAGSTAKASYTAAATYAKAIVDSAADSLDHVPKSIVAAAAFADRVTGAGASAVANIQSIINQVNTATTQQQWQQALALASSAVSATNSFYAAVRIYNDAANLYPVGSTDRNNYISAAAAVQAIINNVQSVYTTANANVISHSNSPSISNRMDSFIDYVPQENFQNPPTQTGPMSPPAIQAVMQFMSQFRNPFKPVSHTYNHETRECQYLQEDSSLVSIYFNANGSVDTAKSNPHPFKLSRMNGVPDTLFQGNDTLSRPIDGDFKSLYNRSFTDDFSQPLMTPSRAGESRSFPQGGVAPVAQNYMLAQASAVYKYVRIRFLKTRVEDSTYVQIAGLQLYGPDDVLLSGKISNLMGSPVDASTSVKALTTGGTWTDTNKSPLMISFDEPMAIVAFGFTTAASEKSTAFDPVRWKVEGSMNGHLWTPLLSQEYMTPMARGVTTPPFRFTQA